jgi:HSP20 family protein
MALVKWTPPKEVEDLRRDIERMYEEFWAEPLLPRLWRKFPKWRRLKELEELSPAVDMYDKKDEIVIKAEIPGIEKENLHIAIVDSTLTIKGEVKKEEEVKDEEYYRRERAFGSFSRDITLPVMVQSDQANATFHDGILEIHLPKAEEAKAKEIEVVVE